MIKIPLFPLPMVIFPDEQIVLHIYEERYKILLKDILSKEENNEIGVPPIIEQKLSSIGTSMQIEEVLEQYEDGTSDVLVSGLRRFRLVKVEKNREYSEGVVEFFDDLEEVSPVTNQREEAISLHMKLQEVANTKFPKKISIRLIHSLFFCLITLD